MGKCKHCSLIKWHTNIRNTQIARVQSITPGTGPSRWQSSALGSWAAPWCCCCHVCCLHSPAPVRDRTGRCLSNVLATECECRVWQSQSKEGLPAPSVCHLLLSFSGSHTHTQTHLLVLLRQIRHHVAVLHLQLLCFTHWYLVCAQCMSVSKKARRVKEGQQTKCCATRSVLCQELCSLHSVLFISKLTSSPSTSALCFFRVLCLDICGC